VAVSAGTHVIKTGDGRDLCVEVAGGRSELTILAHTGTPNSRHLFGAWIEDAQARGVRLVSYDRPGYGGSSPQPGHRVADGAGDVEAIAAALEINGEWLAAHIPGAQADISAQDGHLSIVITRIADIHAWLVGHS
jgi:pimeloyl-ACP methyl ester carboxylesterase